MSEPSIWAPIKALATRVMFFDSKIVMSQDTLKGLCQELIEYERKTDDYVVRLNVLCKQLKSLDLNILCEIDYLREMLLGLDKSRKQLHNKMEELNKEICVLMNKQDSFRKELKEHLSRLCSYKYITVTGVEDLHALMCLIDIKNQCALAFTLGNSTMGKDILGEISVKRMGMGIDIKPGTLYKVQNGQFSVVPEKDHGCFEFEKNKLGMDGEAIKGIGASEAMEEKDKWS